MKKTAFIILTVAAGLYALICVLLYVTSADVVIRLGG